MLLRPPLMIAKLDLNILLMINKKIMETKEKRSRNIVHISKLTVGFQPNTLYLFTMIFEILALVLSTSIFVVQSLITALIGVGALSLSVIGLILFLIAIWDERKAK